MKWIMCTNSDICNMKYAYPSCKLDICSWKSSLPTYFACKLGYFPCKRMHACFFHLGFLFLYMVIYNGIFASQPKCERRVVSEVLSKLVFLYFDEFRFFEVFSNPSLHYVMSLWSNAPIIVPCIGEISFFARPSSSIWFVSEKHRSGSTGNCILHAGLVINNPNFSAFNEETISMCDSR